MRRPIARPAIALAVLLFTAAVPAHALFWMSEPDIKAALGGKTIDGHYYDGRTFTETYETGGAVRYQEGARQAGGHWSVTAGTFCTIYDTDPSGGCFRVVRVGENCFEFYFVARTEEQAKEPGKPDWTARGWVKGIPATCTEGANV